LFDEDWPGNSEQGGLSGRRGFHERSPSSHNQTAVA
jgi:hypothetical protein